MTPEMTDIADLVARTPRHDWGADEVRELFELPFSDLLFAAQSVHRRHFDPHAVQVSTLLSVKTGGCPEDCAYCPQSARYDTGVEGEHMMSTDEVAAAARRAKENGATRFCMGAAFRSPKPRQLEHMIEMIRAVRELELETCLTAGMLTAEQAEALAEAGLDYYNHNIDTSAEYYDKVVTTRSFQERLDTLEAVREAGIHVCCGGIVGMGESSDDRGEMLRTLANLPEHPESVPINQLVQVPGTPFHGLESVDPLDFVRVIAVARILMPGSHVRLAAGRTGMSDETQALCFHAGANSIFYGDKLLTTGNPEHDHDRRLFERLGVRAEAAEESAPGEAATPAPAAARG